MGAVGQSGRIVMGTFRSVWWIILLTSIAYHVGRVTANPETRYYLAKSAEWLRLGVVGENWRTLDFLFDDGLTWLLSVLFGVALKSVWDSSKRGVQKQRAKRQGTLQV